MKGGRKLARGPKKRGHYTQNYGRVARNKVNRLKRFNAGIAKPSEAHKADYDRCLKQVMAKANPVNRKAV